MEDLVLKKVKKNGKKVFTKKKVSDTLKKNYNPLKVNYKIYKRGSEVHKMENVVLERKNELNLKMLVNERIIKNANLFSEEELSIIKDNSNLIEKLYLLGMLDNT